MTHRINIIRLFGSFDQQIDSAAEHLFVLKIFLGVDTMLIMKTGNGLFCVEGNVASQVGGWQGVGRGG